MKPMLLAPMQTPASVSLIQKSILRRPSGPHNWPSLSLLSHFGHIPLYGKKKNTQKKTFCIIWWVEFSLWPYLGPVTILGINWLPHFLNFDKIPLKSGVVERKCSSSLTQRHLEFFPPAFKFVCCQDGLLQLFFFFTCSKMINVVQS